MTETKTPVANELSKVLADSYTLYLKTHGYHWNVRGMQFNSLHTLFMTQYTEMWTALDLIAERIRALGELAPMTGAAFGDLSTIKEGDPELNATDMLKDLKKGHKALISTLETALKVAQDAKDDPSVDLLTTRLAEHQKTLWMITASLD